MAPLTVQTFFTNHLYWHIFVWLKHWADSSTGPTEFEAQVGIPFCNVTLCVGRFLSNRSATNRHRYCHFTEHPTSFDGVP